MNYTDSDIKAIVDTQVELKTKELQNINEKLSNALTSAETKIDKAIELIEKLRMEKWSIMGTDIMDLLSILKGEDNED